MPRKLKRRRGRLGAMIPLLASFMVGAAKVAMVSRAVHLVISSTTPHDSDDMSPLYTNDTLGAHPSHPRLELLHIPRTGGTILEVYAAQHNITWGACHFEFSWKKNPRNPLYHCPKSLSQSTVPVKEPLWHYPLDALAMYNNDGNKNTTTSADAYYYDNLRDATIRQRPKHYFVVLRNPYTRLISFFHKQHARCSHPRSAFNEWLQEEITLATREVCPRNCGATPQYRYVYNDRKERIVRHLLHFEDLHKEFARLLQHYYFIGEPTRTMPPLPHERVNNSKLCATKMQLDDFSNETLDMIHTFYRRDFELGGYDMMKRER